MRDAIRDAIRFFASLIASLKLRDAKFFSDRIPRANFRDAIEGCDPIASLIIPSLAIFKVVYQASHILKIRKIYGLVAETSSKTHIFHTFFAFSAQENFFLQNCLYHI